MSYEEWFSLAKTQIWQLTAVILVVTLLGRFVARNRPHLEHALWLVVILKCLTPPIFATPSGIFCWIQAETKTELLAIERRDAERSSAAQAVTEKQSLGLSPTGPYSSEPAAAPEANVAKLGVPNESAHRGWLLRSTLLVWLVGSAITIAYGVRNWLRCRKQIRSNIETPAELQAILQSAAMRLGVRRSVQLVVTGSEVGPAVLGLWRPIIVLPATLTDRKLARELEPILVHELLHIRRGDLWISMLQLISESIWWFHPLVWYSNRKLSRIAEQCCDEEVLAELNCTPATYARSLLDVLKLKGTVQPLQAFPGVRPLEITSQRLERIMKLRQGCRKRSPWWCFLTMFLLSAVVLPGAGLVGARDVVSNPAAESDDPYVVVYAVKDVLKRIQADFHADESEAKKNLEVSLNGYRVNEAEGGASFSWIGRKLSVRASQAQHREIADTIQTLREHGLQHIQMEIQVIDGPSESINQLHSEWEVVPSAIPAGQGAVDFAPGAAFESPTWATSHTSESRLATVAETIEKSLPALCAVLSDEQANALKARLREDKTIQTVAAPRVITWTGQTAFIQNQSQRPFVVGFRKSGDDHTPQVRVIRNGFEFRLKAIPQTEGTLRLRCQAELSDIRNVKMLSIARGAGKDPLIVQVPEVSRTTIDLAYDVPLDKTFLIGVLPKKSKDGELNSTLLMLRCSILKQD